MKARLITLLNFLLSFYFFCDTCNSKTSSDNLSASSSGVQNSFSSSSRVHFSFSFLPKNVEETNANLPRGGRKLKQLEDVADCKSNTNGCLLSTNITVEYAAAGTETLHFYVYETPDFHSGEFLKYLRWKGEANTFLDIQNLPGSVSLKDGDPYLGYRMGKWRDGDSMDAYATIRLPFDFPYWGEVLKTPTVYVSPHGFVSFNNDTGFLRNIYQDILYGQPDAFLHSAPDADIFPLRMPVDSSLESFNVFYWSDEEHARIQWTNCRDLRDTKINKQLNNKPVRNLTANFTFQLVLEKDGSIFFFYKNMEDIQKSDGLYIGLENTSGTSSVHEVVNGNTNKLAKEFNEKGFMRYYQPSYSFGKQNGKHKNNVPAENVASFGSLSNTFSFQFTPNKNKVVVPLRLLIRKPYTEDITTELTVHVFNENILTKNTISLPKNTKNLKKEEAVALLKKLENAQNGIAKFKIPVTIRDIHIHETNPTPSPPTSSLSHLGEWGNQYIPEILSLSRNGLSVNTTKLKIVEEAALIGYNNTLAVKYAENVVKCGDVCTAYNGCLSAEYNFAFKSCRLKSQNSVTHPQNMIYFSGRWLDYVELLK